jgi:hypothetical protein|tara:strand:- start:1133 stop:1369 length:237 start_codon:yes stop_codon:yes gene_type:complete
MYNYKVTENKEKKFHDERIMAFDSLESRLDSIKKTLRQSKIETIKYYRENPKSYAVIIPTDLISDFLKDVETLLNNTQ